MIGRYAITAELGRGGMARVYRAVDPSDGRQVALKQLMPPSDPKRAADASTLFEREYHTLAQLAHPRVIRVFDYGIDEAGPYYTMELLDGGDLRERSPLPWREACELIFDVCSSLSLVHSRRLVHRDVSPRNVRCTTDGHAKLIDFGAMVPMGANAHLVGTAPFVAPEAVHGAALDARTDLFSLGTTFYFALTGRLAFPARDFSELLETWSRKPAPPSAFDAQIPAALDRLIAALISLEPALRPRSAFEVMQRLAAIAGVRREEALDVSNAYLVTPSLVGRDEALSAFRAHVRRARLGRGRALLFAAPQGGGRSRMLEACALEAKMSGACVLRANAAAGSGHEFAAARALATQLLEQKPEAAEVAARTAGVFETLFEPAPEAAANDGRFCLRSFARPAAERPALQQGLVQWFAQFSVKHLLVVLADDADQLDDPSTALLAALAARARRHAVVVAGAVEQPARRGELAAVEALRARCELTELKPLTVSETEQLLSSVFGDVPNLALLSTRLHAAAAGNPRQTLGLAQHLVDRGTIGYDVGSWSLPPELTAADLPASWHDALRLRVRGLGAVAHRLFAAQSLAEHDAFSRDDYRLLEPDTSAAEIDTALDELLGRQLLTSDGSSFRVLERAAADALREGLGDDERRTRHRALAELYERTQRSAFLVARQRLLAGDYERSFAMFMPLLRQRRERVEFVAVASLPVSDIGKTLAHALELACALPRPLAEQHELRHWLVMLSVADDDALYFQAAPEWRTRLELDSGLADWRSLSHVEDPGQRLTTALEAAYQRHTEAAEHERVYAPDQAIRLLTHYVAISIAIGARTLDVALMSDLPELLEPFAPLSPLVNAIWQNALASRESTVWRQGERSRTRWLKVYEELGGLQAQDTVVEAIRYAIAFGVGLSEAAVGLESAAQWVDILDRDPLQQVNAMYLRKVIRLQQGDLDGAERCRKQAELLALQSGSRQMFTNVLMLEIGVHFAAGDLTGVKQIAASIDRLAEQFPGWVPFRHLAEGHYQRLRGDLPLALEAYRRCLALATPDPADPTRGISAWTLASSACAETLIALDRAPEARDLAAQTVIGCEEREMGATANDVVRSLALAEGKLGDYASAAARLDALLERQQAMGVTGLSLGATYEARARVAIWGGDSEAAERFVTLTGEQYRHGRGSSLGARYERLLEEARSSGVVVLPPLSAFESTMFGTIDASTRASAIATIIQTMAGASDPATRAQRALQLLCESRHAPGGHLFLARERELQLTASLAAPPPDEGLLRAVSEFWAHQRDDDDPDTAPAQSGSSAQAYSAQLWTDQRGTVYQPLLVSAFRDGGPVNVGVAVLVPARAAWDSTTGSQLVKELAGFLLRAGDSLAP